MISTIEWKNKPTIETPINAENLNKIPKSFVEQVFEEVSPDIFSNKVKSAKLADNVTNIDATAIGGIGLNEIFEEDGKTAKKATETQFAEHSNTSETATDADYAEFANSTITEYQEKLYDITIRTQSEFEALIASPTWLDATSVLFVGDGGTLEYSANYWSTIEVPITVKRIDGSNNAKIVVSTIPGLGRFGYNDKISKNQHYQYSINNIHIVTGWFSYCVNINNCQGEFIDCENISNSVGSFERCNNIFNCESRDRVGFKDSHCIINSRALFVGASRGEGDTITGFSGCYKLYNCFAYINATNVAEGWYVTGFAGCEQVNNCISRAECNIPNGGHGYAECKYGTNNRVVGNTPVKTSGNMIKWPSAMNDI